MQCYARPDSNQLYWFNQITATGTVHNNDHHNELQGSSDITASGSIWVVKPLLNQTRPSDGVTHPEDTNCL